MESQKKKMDQTQIINKYYLIQSPHQLRLNLILNLK